MKIDLFKDEWEFLKDKTSFYLNLVEHDNHQRVLNGLKDDFHPDYFLAKKILQQLGPEWVDEDEEMRKFNEGFAYRPKDKNG